METTTRHLVTNIDYLLNNFSDEKLSDFFQMNGKEARLELEERKAKGHKLIGSEGCETFDPIKGCRCHLKQK